MATPKSKPDASRDELDEKASKTMSNWAKHLDGILKVNSKTEEEIDIMRHPDKYPVMKGTGGLRKARIALDDNNKGKSGGARVCFVDFVFAETVYLITVYPKKVKDNLSREERNEIKKVIKTLKKSLGGE